MPRGSHPLNTQYIQSADGRWNQPGIYGCLYTCLSLEGVRAEYGKKIGALGAAARDKERDVVCIEVEIEPVLDLTTDPLPDPVPSRRVLTGDRLLDTILCRSIAGWARSNGFQAIKSPCAALQDEENLNIYTDIPPSRNRSFRFLEEETRPLNYGDDPLVYVPTHDAGR